MHDTPDQVHWHEPKAGENAGFGKFKRQPLPYDRFMEAEGVPCYRGIGVRKVQDLPLVPWKRLGGRGSFIQLYGTEGLWGMYVVEVPGAGALNVERHLYEKVVLVVEGRGTTEVWQEGQNKRHVFEWQKGSLFAIPLNAYHRIINAGSAPALLLCGTTAPNVMNVIDNLDFIFDCPYTFSERFSGAEDFFKPKDDLEPDPIRGLAMRRTNLIPDIVNCDLPLDNRRSPGYRRVEPAMAQQPLLSVDRPARDRPLFQGAQARLRRGARLRQGQGLHLHVAGSARHHAVAERQGRIHQAPGLRAGRARLGRADERRLVSPAFRHRQRGPAHLRLARAEQSARAQARRAGRAAHGLRRHRAAKGGSAIGYHQEDPAIRKEFEATLKREGLPSRMKPEFYERPPAEGEVVMGDVM